MNWQYSTDRRINRRAKHFLTVTEISMKTKFAVEKERQNIIHDKYIIKNGVMKVKKKST